MPDLVRPSRSTLITPDGWKLSLHRALRGGRPSGGPPVLLVHGYGMNASIFGFHPRGASFLSALYDAGLDPWTLDLRGTSTSQAPSGGRVTLADQARFDLPAAFDHIIRATNHPRVHAIGCSLGGALLYAHVGNDDHRVDRLVTMGSPLVWQDLSLPLRAFRRLGNVLAHVPLRGTRTAARAALPLLSRIAPDLLSFYLNPRLTFTGPAGHLAATVEDPHPDINATLARWMTDGHLSLDGRHVTEGLGRFERPLLVVVAEGDGVVPSMAAECAATATGGPSRILRVSHPLHRVSHVDLFIGDHVHDAVYRPVSEWLTMETPDHSRV